ncbi:conserved oligomeric Golgi complex subunit 1 [Cocos nucifera]|uniref:Conserved oligomeric Golgi complex subunit 1 n=1 Tax=Cocos nucifera TaxID=13894 RepID=A0A8K0NDP9_COCNU|nr:conserved oligomeric Golgi complex subunit 1 [Cocos nucifera]
MRSPSTLPAAEIPTSAAGSRDAESLFRKRPILEIRAVEAATRREIEEKKEELRQLVGKSYRDLIESADSILLMKSSCDAISSNLTAIDAALLSLSTSAANPETPKIAHDPARARVYGIASRVKYLVDTPENIWGCLDESMLLEASGRYLRAKTVHGLVTGGSDADALAKFPLLRHQWQIVESFKAQISQRSRERLMDRGLTVAAYADALSAAATIDDLNPKQVLGLFLDSRRSWISQKLDGVQVDSYESLSSVLCDVVRTIRTSLGQVGELFVLALNEMPLFYKIVLGSPPGTQLFGGIPNPEEEVRLWKSHREKLESAMVLLESEFIAQTCSSWLKSCCDEIFGQLANGKHLMDAIGSGEGLGCVEKMVREALDGREGLDESLEQWLRSVFGSEIESPWNQIREHILRVGKDILEDRLEVAFLKRMKEIVHSEFDNLSRDINMKNSIESIVAVAGSKDENDFQTYLKKPSTGGGVWFSEPNQKKAGILYSFKPTADENDFGSCLNAYFGPEVTRIRDAVDSKCRSILDDLLCFVESHNSTLRLKELKPNIQEKCYKTISVILKELDGELVHLSASLGSNKGDKDSLPPSVIVERSLFIGRLLFALRNHSSHIPVILGSPRQWVKETTVSVFTNLSSPLPKQSKMTFNSSVSFSPRRHTFDSPRSPRRQFSDNPRRQTISAAASLYSADDSENPKLDELKKTLQELCIRAHSLWITWVSNELSVILSKDLNTDDALSATTALRGWEVTVIKQEESTDGPLEMKIALPSMPSLYITSFLFQACLEIHKVGGHVLDKIILQNFASRIMEKQVCQLTVFAAKVLESRSRTYAYGCPQVCQLTVFAAKVLESRSRTYAYGCPVIDIYENFLSSTEGGEARVSEKGALQILLDLRFIADILSGGKDSASRNTEMNVKEESSKIMTQRLPFRWKQPELQPGSANIEPAMKLINKLSQKLDPIDWAIYEPYLWENEKQSYKRFAVLFGFLVQLNRMYTDTVQKLPTKSNTDSNIMRCSAVPRFKYLPISAPALSSRGAHKSTLQMSADDASSSSPWKAYSNGERSPKPELDDTLSFGVATPLLKSIMTQVGSKFGESASRWGSMLSDGQAGKLKDRSAAAMSTFGDMLPGPAAGLLSSLTSGATSLVSQSLAMIGQDHSSNFGSGRGDLSK